MKKFYLAAACIVLAQPALAGAREDARAAEQRCSAYPDDRTWLECSYGALQAMRAKLGLQPAPDFQQRLVPPASQAYAPVPPASAPVASVAPLPVTTATASPPPTHRRGSFMQVLGGTAPPVAVSALASVRFDNQGAFIVTLETARSGGRPIRSPRPSRISVWGRRSRSCPEPCGPTTSRPKAMPTLIKLGARPEVLS